MNKPAVALSGYSQVQAKRAEERPIITEGKHPDIRVVNLLALVAKQNDALPHELIVQSSPCPVKKKFIMRMRTSMNG